MITAIAAGQNRHVPDVVHGVMNSLVVHDGLATQGPAPLAILGCGVKFSVKKL